MTRTVSYCVLTVRVVVSRIGSYYKIKSRFLNSSSYILLTVRASDPGTEILTPIRQVRQQILIRFARCVWAPTNGDPDKQILLRP